MIIRRRLSSLASEDALFDGFVVPSPGAQIFYDFFPFRNHQSRWLAGGAGPWGRWLYLIVVNSARTGQRKTSSAEGSHLFITLMTTAEERMAPRVPAGGRPREMSKSRAFNGSEDPLFDAVNGAFISALLQHALDNLSATPSTSKGEGKSERFDLEPKPSTLPRPGVCDRDRPIEETLPEKVSKRCIMNATAQRDSSALKLDKSVAGGIQQYAFKDRRADAADAGQYEDELKNTGTNCLQEDGPIKASIVVVGNRLRNNSQSAFSAFQKTDLASRGDVTSGKATALTSAAARELTPASVSQESAATSKCVYPSVTPLLEVPEAVKAQVLPAGSMSNASVPPKACCHMGTTLCTTMTDTAVATASAAVTASLLCSAPVTCCRSSLSNDLLSLPDNATPKKSAGDGMRHTPFQILLSRLCDNAELEKCIQDSSFSEHDGVLRKSFSKHQEDNENSIYTNVQNVRTAQPHTLPSDISSRLHERCGPAFADEGRVENVHGMLVERSRAAASRESYNFPGALVQQQFVGRALLTRLASLQVQQALLRCTVTMPQFSSQATALCHMHSERRLGHPSYEKFQSLLEKDDKGSRSSHQVSHGEWPPSEATEGPSAVFHTHLQHSELLSLMQNHTACVFHFVLRALSLLANCCPLWAAAGHEEVSVHAGASAACRSIPDNGEVPRTTSPKSRISKENEKSVLIEAQNGDEPSTSTCTCEKSPTNLGKSDEVLPASYSRDWTFSTSSRESSSILGRKDGTKDSKSTEPLLRRPVGYTGISSYRWHWMHIVSFLTHPELLSIYHSTLAPLLSLFVPSAQTASGKRCARIESLDTSSSHEDEASIAAEHNNDKTLPPTSQRPNTGTNSNCCGAGSWFVVRQVLCDLDDLRFLHDSSFAPCPHRQDPSYSANHQQQQMKLNSSYSQAHCSVPTQGSPLLCCSAPKCSERCPGAFYCGTALLRSSIFFSSFFEATQALAVWPQHLAATAAAALPLSSGTARRDRSAFLDLEEKEVASRSSSGSHRHKRDLSTKEQGSPAVSAQRREWSCERVSKSSRIVGEHPSNRRAELSDAAGGVAACILKHVDLNKLDAKELLALLKLTEEAGSLSPLSPCGECHRVEQDPGGTYSANAMIAPVSSALDCNGSLTQIAALTQSVAADAVTPSGSATAFKQCLGDLNTGIDIGQPARSPHNMNSASMESYHFAGGSGVEANPVIRGGDAPCGAVVCHRIAPASVQITGDCAPSAKRANRGPDNAPESLLIADKKAVSTNANQRTLLRFSPLFTPRQPQPRRSTLSAFDQVDASENEVKGATLGISVSRGQQQPIDTSVCHPDPALRGLLCPVAPMEKPSQLVVTTGIPSCLERSEKDTISRDSMRSPEASTRETLLTLTAPAVISERDLPQLADALATCQPSPANPLGDPSSASPIFAARVPENQLQDEIVHCADCTPSTVQEGAAFTLQERVSQTLKSEQMTESSTECSAIPQASAPDFLHLAVAVTPSQHSQSEVGTAAGAGCVIVDGGKTQERSGEGRKAISALDVVEHERALSLVAAGVRNTRKRFRLQSERRKAEARFHFDMPCMTFCSGELIWGKDALARVPLEEISTKAQEALAASQSSSDPISAGSRESYDSGPPRPSGPHVNGGTFAAVRKTWAGTTCGAGNSSQLDNGCNVRSPVKGIYYDSYKKLWRVQWNCSFGTSQPVTTNVSVNAAAQTGAGRRVSRSFSCARLGFEAAKARAVAWMLSGGHVGDGGLAEGGRRANAEDPVDHSFPGTVAPGASGVNRSTGKQRHELEKTSSTTLSKTRQAAGRQELAEREEKERLLFDNPKLFLERVEAFYVRNGLYGLQCGNRPGNGPAERHRGVLKDPDEHQQSAGASLSAASTAGNSRKGNGGTGGLRIVSVLSLDDMLEIVQGKKTTMSLPCATVKHTSPESRSRTGPSAVAPDPLRVSQANQHQASEQASTVQKGVPSQSYRGDLDKKGESARKKSRTRVPEFAGCTEGAGHVRASELSVVEQTRDSNADAERTEKKGGVAASLLHEAERCGQAEKGNGRAQNRLLCVGAAVNMVDQEGRWY